MGSTIPRWAFLLHPASWHSTEATILSKTFNDTSPTKVALLIQPNCLLKDSGPESHHWGGHEMGWHFNMNFGVGHNHSDPCRGKAGKNHSPMCLQLSPNYCPPLPLAIEIGALWLHAWTWRWGQLVALPVRVSASNWKSSVWTLFVAVSEEEKWRPSHCPPHWHQCFWVL